MTSLPLAWSRPSQNHPALIAGDRFMLVIVAQHLPRRDSAKRHSRSVGRLSHVRVLASWTIEEFGVGRVASPSCVVVPSRAFVGVSESDEAIQTGGSLLGASSFYAITTGLRRCRSAIVGWPHRKQRGTVAERKSEDRCGSSVDASGLMMHVAEMRCPCR